MSANPPCRLRAAALLLVVLPIVTGSAPVAAAESPDLVGLWEAQRRFGPDIRGTLTLEQRDGQWRVEIAGHRALARLASGSLTAVLPGDLGALNVRLPASGETLVGHWSQQRSAVHGLRYASPVILRPTGGRRWQGTVTPFDDHFTLQLAVDRHDDGSLRAFLRNPERNLGIFWRLDRLELRDHGVDLISSRDGDERVIATGSFHGEDDRLSIYVGGRGGTYDLERRPPEAPSSFFPRGEGTAGPFVYQPPEAGDDGWPVGSLDDVGIAVEPIQGLIEDHFSSAPESVRDVYPHGLLIARHGRLVFEEYFHGFHRDRPHDTRSASKSLTAVIAGAAIEAGLPLAASTPVYATLRPGAIDAADPRRSRMTLEHLLTMSSGLACNDSDPDSPGNEEIMQEQTEQPDWYAFTLDLPMTGEPGAQAFYCSATANLAGAVISEASGEALPDLFHRLVAEPLQIGTYHLPLTPTGEAYMGGGIRWLPRDFLKLGQLMLDGGTWNGRRIVSERWTARSITPLHELRDRGYGYLWWSVEYPYRDRTVRAFFAGGNGGQVLIGVPELDLLVAFFAGNYSDRTLFRYQEEFFPEYILAAVSETHGDEAATARPAAAPRHLGGPDAEDSEPSADR